MIQIYIKNEGPTVEVTVAGHAGYAEPGKDIVCAGVSALFMGLCDCAEDAGVEQRYTDGPDAKRVVIYRTMAAQRWLDMFRAGVQAVIREYPDYVRLDG